MDYLDYLDCCMYSYGVNFFPKPLESHTFPESLQFTSRKLSDTARCKVILDYLDYTDYFLDCYCNINDLAGACKL